MEIVFGTRKSKWALAATNAVIQKAKESNPDTDFQVVQMDSPGDLNHGDLAKIGGTTSFVDAISREVAACTIDAAVHTVKDISWPSNATDFPDGSFLPSGLRTTGNLLIAAVGKRSDPRDAVVFRSGESLSTFDGKEIRVGTGSLVRAAIIRKLWPEATLNISRIRGNIDLRLEKLDRGEYDALILSMDGLIAVGQADRANRIFSVEEMPPALGQAIGAVEIREDNHRVLDVIRCVNDPVTQTCLRVEWAILRRLHANCYTPIGGVCTMQPDGRLSVFAAMFDADGGSIDVRMANASTESPEDLGFQVADELLRKGAKRFQESWIGRAGELSQDAT